MKTADKSIVENSRERTVLLKILRAGLWESRPDNFAGLPLTGEEWENVFILARQQAVTGLTFRGLQYLPDNLLPSEDLLMRWIAETDAIERKNKKMNVVLEELYTFFCRMGLNPVLQKGQGTARFYDYPLLRQCGDIDFYFNNCSAWNAALMYIRRQGIPLQKQGDGSVVYQWKGINIEHHQQLFDLYNPFQQGIVNSLEEQKGYMSFTLSARSDVPVTVPSPFLELLLHNLHILKHTLGRGIGLRQLCDMARACYQLRKKVDALEMEAVCRKLGLDKWGTLLHAFLTEQLGLSEAYLPYPAIASTAQPLADVVWRGGNFGQYNIKLNHHIDGWQHKWQTVRSFGSNVRFAFHYAPKEALGFFVQLMKGQIQ